VDRAVKASVLSADTMGVLRDQVLRIIAVGANKSHRQRLHGAAQMSQRVCMTCKGLVMLYHCSEVSYSAVQSCPNHFAPVRSLGSSRIRCTMLEQEHPSLPSAFDI